MILIIRGENHIMVPEVHSFVKVKELSQFCHKVICQTSVVSENSFRNVLKEKIIHKQHYVYVPGGQYVVLYSVM